MNSPCCRRLIWFVGACALSVLGADANAAQPAAAGKEPVVEAKDLPRYPAVEPADAVKTIKVKKGFKVELVASEPNIASPIAVSFDERGRDRKSVV